MKRPQDADASSSGDSLKASIPCPTPPSPSAHPAMLPPEHPDAVLQPSPSPSAPIYAPDSTRVLHSLLSPLLIESPQPPQHDHVPSNLTGSSGPLDAACPDGAPALADKGKAKELPPTLPPLSLSPPGLGYNVDDWSSTPGPSSYRSTCPSVHTDCSGHSPSSSTESTAIHTEPPAAPSRTRSLSNLSIHSTTPSMSKIRIKLAASSKAPANLARRLLSRNKAEATGPTVTGPEDGLVVPLEDGLIPFEAENCLFPWQTKDSTRASSPRIGVDAQAVPDVATVWYPDNHRLDGIQVGSRPKGGRSFSSPFPKSVFDIVPQVDFEDKFIPLPLHARDLFDELLPRELCLRVFSALILLHEADHERMQHTGRWSVLVASSSKNRWVGRNRAMRELVKLSRVSKLWRTLVFDGQLWQNVDLRTFPAASTSFLASLVELSGPFVKNLDLSGHAHLSPTALIDVAGGLCVRSAPVLSFTYTQLTAIALQGCTALTTQSLHSLLIRSPFLRSLNVKGLQAVTNATFDVLALCSHLTSLNMSRCVNIDGDGVRAFGAAVMARGARLALKELWLSGLSAVNDDTLAALGKAAPHLEVLDLSYCRSLHNSALGAFVSCEEDEKTFGEAISLTSRQAGRDPRDSRRYSRRVTALRHLSLSSCIMLTDTACSNLAHSVPRLEFLELAGIGDTLQDDGLVHLLGTTPFIRKLDLEDASDITDAVLEVLIQEPEVEGSALSRTTQLPQPGHALEHLTVSSAGNLTNDTFKALIRACPKLRVLEADRTAISGTVLKEFIRQVGERGIDNAGLVVVDCRSIGERVVKDVVGSTRPRKGWRSWEARKLGYLDGRDGEDLKVGQDECDEKRVVIKSFYGWQTVDTVRNTRERKKKANKKVQRAMSDLEDDGRPYGRLRWWSRTPSGSNTPSEDDRNGCVVM